jgi:hypothetical protein
MTVDFFHTLSPVLKKLQNILHLVDYCTYRLKYMELDLQSLFGLHAT